MKNLYLILIASLVFHQLNAQKNDTLKNATVIPLNEVIVTANRIDQYKSDVPQLIDIITAKEISLTNAQTSADLLQKQANVFVQRSQQGGGSPVLRGFEANKILLEVDGIRMNNLIFRGGHLQNILNIDANNLDRVEVIYGPASTIYGSDALGGVIHFYTKRPVLSTTDNLYQRTNAFFRYGSVNNELTGHFDCNLGSKKFASFTSFTFSKFFDLTMGRMKNPISKEHLWERNYYAERINGMDSMVASNNKYQQKQSGYWQFNFLQNFLIQQNSKITHRINLQYTTSSNIPRYDRLTDVSGSGKLKSAEWYYGPQALFLGAYILEVKNTFFDEIKWTSSYQNVKESRHNRNFGSSNRNDRYENVNVAATTLSFLKNIKKHKLNFGIDAQLNWLKSRAEKINIVTLDTLPLDARYPDGKNYQHNAAAYFMHEWNINDKLILTDGVRLGYTRTYARIADNSFYNLPVTKFVNNNFVYSGNIGLVYKYLPNQRVYANFSTGYRVPNIDDLAKIFESVPGTVIVPNNKLRPEKTLNVELGFSNYLFKSVQLDINGFYTYILDAVTTQAYQLNGQDSVLYDGTMSKVLANQNKQKAFVAGVSAALSVKFAKYFTWSNMFNYTYGRILTDTTNIPLDHIAPILLQSKFAFDYKKLNTFVAFNFQGAKKLKDYNPFGEDNLNYATANGTPAWFTLDFGISYQLYKYVTAQFGIDNILDTQYRAFASGINAPGRNFKACVRVHF